MPLRLLLDQNLSPETTRFLRDELKLDATDTREQGLQTADDQAIAEFAQRTERVVVTFNGDFGDVRDCPPENYPGVIRLRIHPQTIEILHPVLKQFFEKIAEVDLRGTLIVVDRRHYRIRRKRGSE
jgi:predicted nuclease of predicted toxin-antitoxin system